MEVKVAYSIPINKRIKRTPEGYLQRGAYLVNLAERYAIAGRLLGKAVMFRYNDVYFEINIPAILFSDGCPILGMPGILETFGIDIDNWGKINNYQRIDKLETVRAWLSTVLVVCYAKDQRIVPTSLYVQRLAKKVVYALQLINPDAIRVSSDEANNDICEVKHSVVFQEDGRPQIGICISSVIDDGKNQLSIHDINLAIKNAGKTVSAPYEMLGNARVNLSRNDVRAAVLNCATSIEVMLKELVSGYLIENKISEELREYVIGKADGYARLIELCKKLKIPIDKMPDVQQSIMKIRHKVIHGGYVPSYEEAKNAYEITRKTLKSLAVPIFI